MKTQFSRVRLALTAVTAAALLAGCGADADGSSDEAIKIGVIVPLTGPTSTLGPVADGIQAYFDDVNSNGGIDGVSVDVVVKDDAYDPSKTPAQARALVEQENVDMMCAPTGTGPVSAIYPYLKQRNVPTLALSGSPEFAGSDSPVFQQLPDYTGLGAFVADFAVNDLKKQKIAIAFSPDGVGEPFKEGAVKELSELGIEPTLVEFNPSAPDQSTVAAKLKQSGAQVVLVNHVAPIVSAIAKAASQQGYRPQWASTFALNDAKFAELTGGSLDGVYVATPYLIGSEDEAAPYREAVAAYDKDVDPLDPVVMEGWATADVCGQVLAKAVEDAGGKPSRDQILAAMKDITVDTTYVDNLTWTEDDHTGQKSSQITTFDGEKFVQYKPFAPFPS